MDETALLGLGAQSDPQAQQRAWQYFEQLKSSDNGWELCANALNAGLYANNDHVKFFCFQVIEFYLKERYANAGAEEQQKLKAFLLGWLQMHCQDQSKDRTFICNKAAQVFALAFVVDFPSRWPSFFVDLLTAAGNHGVPAVWIYLRVLMAIDTEVVDRDISHTDPEYQRNTLLKDNMREHSVAQMVDSWYHIISSYETSEPQMTCFCLGVIGAYVAWIDINLIANDKFVSVLLKFTTMPLLRESACDCIHEVILKGMDPPAKTRLIESFCTVLHTSGVFNVTQDEEGDYLSKLSKLINGMGLQLIQGWQKLTKVKDTDNAKVTLDALENKVPLMLKFLSNEDDDVSGAVTQFAHDYITTLKQLCPLTEARQTMVKELLFVVVEKMKFDDSYSFEHEGEDEAMFQEYRKELKVIFNNLGALDSQLLLSTVREITSRTFNTWQSVKYQDAEMAVSLLYQLAEALPASHGQHFSSGDPNKASAVQEMLRLMLTSKVCCYQHSSVQLQFFETVVRYDKFFNIEPEHIADVLVAFLDERGLRNASSHVRSRTAYLFSRFVKALNKQNLQPYLEDILTRVHDLLILNSPDNGMKHYLSGDDQFFMYETAGILIVHSQFEPEKKQALMKQLLAPIVEKFEGLLSSMMAESDEDRQLLYAQCLSQAMACASRTSKGFTAAQTMQVCGCVGVYTDTLRLFLHALNAPVHRPLLHIGVRQFLHRMVVCLDAAILPFVPIALDNLLLNNSVAGAAGDAKELHDFIPLINQVVSKFKKLIVPFLQSVFMSIVTTIFRVLSAPVDERDQVAHTERKMLQRSYFGFLGTLVNNDVGEVLSSQEASNLQQVLMTVIQGAVEIPDPQAQKTCYGVMRKLIELWAVKEGGLPGFTDFMYEHIVPACFMGPLKPTFELSDAQTVLALNECAMCLKTINDKRGEEFVDYLQNKYLPTQNVSPEISLEFCQALKAENKVFKSYLKSFFLRAKS